MDIHCGFAICICATRAGKAPMRNSVYSTLQTKKCGKYNFI
jgi:hypothetical protein